MKNKHCISATEMLTSEQEAYDICVAAPTPPADGLLASEPVLQAPSGDSMGVAFAVNGLSVGFAEVSESPGMEGATRFLSEGFPRVAPDDRILRVRIEGLKPGTRHWYRVGAARLAHPIGYWSKLGDIAWSNVHSFVTPGSGAPSRFAVFGDTHADFPSMARATAKYRALDVPLVVWNGDVLPSKIDDRESLVRHFIDIPENAGYAADTPILFNCGNHDYRGDWAGKLGDAMMPRPPREVAGRHPALDRNFAVRMGEIALIGLDTGEDKPDDHVANAGITAFSRQRQLQAVWLEDALSSKEIAEAPFAVAVVHIPLFDPDPDANPGTVLINYAQWQKECADLWRPALERHGVGLVVAGHTHRYRFDPPSPDRSWAQLVCGGAGDNTFQTLAVGEVEDGELVVRVHDTDSGTVAAVHRFKPRERLGE
jgi:predicted phosphodiesterase